MSGGGGHTTATTTTSNLPEYAEPYYTALIQRGQTESTRPYQAYTGQRIADTASETGHGLTMAGEFADTTPLYAQSAGDMATAGGLAGLAAQMYTPLAVQSRYAGPTTQSYAPAQIDTAQIDPSVAFQGPSGYTPGEFTSQQISAGGAGGASARGGTVQGGYSPADLTYQTVRSNYSGPVQGTYDPNDNFTNQNIDTSRFTADVRDQYMSPYMDAVIQTAQQNAAEAYQIEETMRNLDAAASGAFGGSRYAVQQQMGRNDMLDRISDIFVQGRQSAFENAQGQFERDESRRLTADQANQAADLRAQELSEQSRQFGYRTSEEFYRDAARMGLEAALANQRADLDTQFQEEEGRRLGAQLEYSASRDTAANQTSASIASAQNSTQASIASMQARLAAAQANQMADLRRQEMAESSKQFGYSQDLSAEIAAGQQGLSLAQSNQGALLDAQRLGESSRQFGFTGDISLENLRSDAARQAMEADRANQAAGLEALNARIAGGNLMQTASNNLTGAQSAVDSAMQDRIRAMLGAGQAREDIQQQYLDTAYDDFINQRDVERQNLQFLSSLLQGVPVSANQNVVTTQPTNPLQGLLGSATGLQALYQLGQS